MLLSLTETTPKVGPRYTWLDFRNNISPAFVFWPNDFGPHVLPLNNKFPSSFHEGSLIHLPSRSQVQTSPSFWGAKPLPINKMHPSFTIHFSLYKFPALLVNLVTNMSREVDWLHDISREHLKHWLCKGDSPSKRKGFGPPIAEPLINFVQDETKGSLVDPLM